MADNNQILENVMTKIESFYFEDGGDSGEAIFNDFAKEHEHLFEEDCDAIESENKLEYTTVYNKFCEMFEKHIERIIASCGISVEQFFNALKNAHEKDEDAGFYVEILLSVTDFANFVDMMKHYKKEHPPQKKE